MRTAARTDIKPDRLRPVAGRHNQRLKDLRLAFRRAELTPHGECAIEGVKLLEEALRSGQHLDSVFFSESARPLAEKLLPQIGARTETLVLPNALFNSIVPSDSPQGVAALVKLRTFSSEQLLDRSADGPLVVAAGLQDPGNLGTILRSAEAFGAAGIFLTEGTVSPYNSKVLRGSAGSIFRLPFLRDLFRGTDSPSARARCSPAGNFFAPGNSAAPDLVDSAARNLHRQRRRRSVR